MSETAKTIDMTPEGLTTKEGIRRSNAAIQAFTDATAEVANLLTNLLGPQPDKVEHNLRAWAKAFGDDLDEDDLQDVVRAIKVRANAQEEMLRSITGAKPMKVFTV